MTAVVTVARSDAEVERLRDRWRLLPIDQVHAQLDFFLTVAKTRPEVLRPHVVLFPSMRVGSAVFAAANALGGALRREHFSETQIHRRLTLPATYDEFLAT